MKRVRKIIPVSLYDIPGLERWLEEQADLGLFPVHLGSWATFERRGVPGTRFRLDVFANKAGEGTEPTPEKLELLRQAGWEYALTVGNRLYHLFYTTDPGAVELYTDWESQGLSLERTARRIRFSRKLQIFLPILLFVVALFLPDPASRFDIQHSRYIQKPLTLLGLFHPLAMPLLLLLCLFTFDYRIFLRTHQAMKQGLPPPPSPGPSRMVKAQNAALLFAMPLLILLYLGYVGGVLELQIPLRFLPAHVELTQLDPAASMTAPEDGSFLHGHAGGGYSFSLLAPVWYEISQESAVPITYRETRSGEYGHLYPKLDMTYFHLLIPALARPVAQAQMDSYRLVNLLWSYEEVEWPGTDFVILATEPDGIWQMAAVGHGGQVVVYRYGGLENLADHLEQLTQPLTEP